MIENLFIIGNGFDRGHRMKTAYDDFREWLVELYPSAENTSDFTLSFATMMPKGDMFISAEDMAGFVVYCIEETSGEKWCNFEDALGKIDWTIFFDDLDDILDNEGDIDLFKTAYAREDYTSELHFNAQSFTDLFSKWINEIEYPRAISRTSFLSDSLTEKSLFLTFNYTKTLEDIYGIQPAQVCHIHGSQGKEIIVGHGVSRSSSNMNDDEYETEYDFGMDGIDEIHNMLKKPTEHILVTTDFFRNLKKHDITNIYSWGFSFSDVDLCYIKEICKSLDTINVIWHLHDHCKSDCDKFESILRRCGFNGNITTFSA